MKLHLLATVAAGLLATTVIASAQPSGAPGNERDRTGQPTTPAPIRRTRIAPVGPVPLAAAPRLSRRLSLPRQAPRLCPIRFLVNQSEGQRPVRVKAAATTPFRDGNNTSKRITACSVYPGRPFHATRRQSGLQLIRIGE